MTDFLPVPPPPDGFARAVASARRRRLRTAGLSTGVAGVGLAVAAVLMGSSGTSSLSQEAPLTHQPTEAPAAAQGSPVANVAPASATTASATGFPEGVGSAAPTVSGAPGSQPRTTVGPHYVAAPISSRHNQLTVPNCLGGEGPVCMSVGRSSGELSASGCPSQTGPVVLHFPDEREVDFWVTRGSRTVWQWSASHPATGRPHTGQLDSGHCSSWTLPWDDVDGQGRKLPPGDYVLHARMLARETPQPGTDYPFTLSG